MQGRARSERRRDADVGAEITEQTQTEIERSLGFITLFLAIFSFIALGVGMFVIYNVFSITAAQRQRENALLRAIGASRRQVTWAMLIESAVIGLLGSIAGLFGGIGLALGIRNLLDALDYSHPGARAGARAVHGGDHDRRRYRRQSGRGDRAGDRRRACAAGRGDGRHGVRAHRLRARPGDRARRRVRCSAARRSAPCSPVRTRLLLGGAASRCCSPAVLLFGPVMAKPIARLLGAPVQRWRGVTGAMARGNVQRNPKRTARTAAPVLIGVALVTGASVFAASIKVQLRDDDRVDVRRRLRHQLEQRRRAELQPGVHRRAQHPARGRRGDRPRLRPARRRRRRARRSGRRSTADGGRAA